MRIGIDGRLINETGVGRYIKNLIDELSSLDNQNNYIVFLRQNAYESFKLPNNHWQKRLADIPWHSFTEQLLMPVVFAAEKIDLLHIPYFNVPIFYPGKFIVTIHDLTILHFDTGRATTLPWILYKVRRLGYYLVLLIGLFRAEKIIAVSEATKREIIEHFHVGQDKIVVTYEGVDKKMQGEKFKVKNEERIIKNPYLLYVGNAYPHKNLEILLRSFKLLKPQVKLVMVGEIDYFYKKLSQEVDNLGLRDDIVFFGEAQDSQLKMLYHDALALVFPSLMEGFGLPGLEAMAVGTPVVCSDLPVFHEIYGEAALYFNPENEKDSVSKLELILKDKKLRQSLIEKGKKLSQNFQWRVMAEKTLSIYNKTKV